MTSRPAAAQHLRDITRLRRVRDRIDREYAQPLDVEALARDALGFEVRNDVGNGKMRWITVGPAYQPGTSIVLHPPAANPGITVDERRTIAEMMAKGTYAMLLLATKDLDGTFERQGQRRRRRPGADRAAVRGSRLRLPRSRGQPDPHPGVALSRFRASRQSRPDPQLQE